MAPRHTPARDVARQRPLYRAGVAVLYVAALAGLIVWEFRDHLEIGTPPCEVVDSVSHSLFFAAPYHQLLSMATRESASHVSVVAIPQDLESIQSNLCRARAYVADLLTAIGTQHPGEVVLDKYYGPDSCGYAPEDTAALANAVRSLPVPVVVGESTGVAAEERQKTCLVHRAQMDFQAPNVVHGLTRLNAESEKIPLTWMVLPVERGQTSAVPQDSLAWAAVKAYDPEYAAQPHFRSVIDPDSQPYARLQNHLPRATSTEVLCAFGTPEMRQRWDLKCDGSVETPRLTGRVVMIGSEQGSDLRSILGKPVWGLDLQASFVEDLLSDRFLRSVPFFVEFLLFAAFVFAIEGLPTVLQIARPGWKRKRLVADAYRRSRYAWVSSWALLFLVVTVAVCLAMGYLPPLLILGDIVLVAITRLFLFAIDSFEEPLVHHHKKGHHEHRERPEPR